MTYEQLPMREVDLEDLLLDLDNYRIPTRRDDEAGALKYLFSSEDVLTAARLILRDGYFDNEVPIVIEAPLASGKFQYTVLEGNRRVSALKALHDPTIVPGHETSVRTLLKRYAVEAENLPKRIRVIVAPNKATAAPHVARLHTGASKKRWSRDQQANFYYSLLDGQTTVDDVKAQYPDVEVARFMKMAVMRRFLSSAPFSDHSLREYAGSADLAMSVFEYAYRNKDIAAAIGVAFDKDGLLVPPSLLPDKIAAQLPRAHLAALEYLIGEFRAERLNTRSPEFKQRSDAHRMLLDRLLVGPTIGSAPLAPAPVVQPTPVSVSTVAGQATPSTTTGEGADGASPPTQSAVGPGSRGPNHPHTKDRLDLSGLDYESAAINLKLRYFELRAISLSGFPVAAAMLLRSVLEATIKEHFDQTPTPATGLLSEVFKHVVATYGKDKSLQSKINVIQSGNAQKRGSIQWFNLIAHSAGDTVKAEDVRDAWTTVNPLLKRLLRPPMQSGSATP